MPNSSRSPSWCDAAPSNADDELQLAAATARRRTSRGRSASIDSTVPENGPCSPASALHGRTCSGRTPTMTSDGTSGPGAPWASSIAPAFSRSEPAAALGGEPAERHRRAADEAGHEHVRGPVVDLLRVADLLEHARSHHGDPVAHRHRLDLVVGDEHGRDAGLALERLDLGAHVDPQLGVQVRERLVHQEHLRVSHQRPAERHPLALAAGQLPRLSVEQAVQPQPRRPPRSPAARTSALRHLARLAARTRGFGARVICG